MRAFTFNMAGHCLLHLLQCFGTFTVKDKKERQGRNPRTGETINIAAKRDASFKPGKELSAKLILSKTEATPA